LISEEQKAIVDDFVAKHSIEQCIFHIHKLNTMNNHLLRHHMIDREKDKADIVQKNIDSNNIALKYLENLYEKNI